MNSSSNYQSPKTFDQKKSILEEIEHPSHFNVMQFGQQGTLSRVVSHSQLQRMKSIRKIEEKVLMKVSAEQLELVASKVEE